MGTYRVVYIRTVVEEEWIDAASVDEAQKKWEAEGHDAELFFIEDEDGNQIIYD